jgi:hypothetical protein
MLITEVGQARPWRVVRVIQVVNEDVLPSVSGSGGITST